MAACLFAKAKQEALCRRQVIASSKDNVIRCHVHPETHSPDRPSKEKNVGARIRESIRLLAERAPLMALQVLE